MSEMASVNDPVTGRFLNGNPSAYRLRLARKAKIRDGLIADYCFDAPTHKLLLDIIVQYLDDASHARKKTDRTRAGNSARRLLRDVPRKQSDNRTLSGALDAE